MAYQECDFLQISGIQHFMFCRRQWALIHIEGLWAENLRTVNGEIFHERAHDPSLSEKRGDMITVRALRVFSSELGISGECDVVEFRRDDENGAKLRGRDGRWIPTPIEYKSGSSKAGEADRLQLCAQAMCLEEMLGVEIELGYMFYGETPSARKSLYKRRTAPSGGRCGQRDAQLHEPRLHAQSQDRQILQRLFTQRALSPCPMQEQKRGGIYKLRYRRGR